MSSYDKRMVCKFVGIWLLLSGSMWTVRYLQNPLTDEVNMLGYEYLMIDLIMCLIASAVVMIGFGLFMQTSPTIRIVISLMLTWLLFVGFKAPMLVESKLAKYPFNLYDFDWWLVRIEEWHLTFSTSMVILLILAVLFVVTHDFDNQNELADNSSS